MGSESRFIALLSLSKAPFKLYLGVDQNTKSVILLSLIFTVFFFVSFFFYVAFTTHRWRPPGCCILQPRAAEIFRVSTIFKATRHSSLLRKECTWGVTERIHPRLATSGVMWMQLKYAPVSQHSRNESQRVIAGLKAPRPFLIYSSNLTAISQISGGGEWVGSSKYSSPSN